MSSVGNRGEGGSIPASAWARDGQQQYPKKQVIPSKVTTADDIPTIPDADDLADNLHKSLSMEKSVNPSAMYGELDSELLKQYSYTTVDGVNMALLLKFIHPDVNVKEPDVPWTVDSLFSDLAEYYKDGKK